MKKLLVFLGLIFVGTFAFANIELDVNMYGMGKALSLKDNDDSNTTWDVNQSFAFGFEDAINFYFGGNASKFDAGLGLFLNCDFFKKAEFKVKETTFDYEGTGFNAGFGIGPVFRITFSNPFSLYIRPTLGFNLFVIQTDELKDYDNSTYKNTLAEFDIFKFDLNIGGRSWLLNTDGFHLGIDYGISFGLGGGFGSFTSTLSGARTTGVSAGDADFKVYVGCCMNFGDRGIDR